MGSQRRYPWYREGWQERLESRSTARFHQIEQIVAAERRALRVADVTAKLTASFTPAPEPDPMDFWRTDPKDAFEVKMTGRFVLFAAGGIPDEKD